MAERALTAVIQEPYIQGISTRSVNELVMGIGTGGISNIQVSRHCEEIDERVQVSWTGRSMATSPIPGSTPPM